MAARSDKKIRIVIGDYSSFSRLVLADILNAEKDMEVLATADNGDELIACIRQHQPHLVIADYFLPKNTRLFIFRRIQDEFKLPILMIIGKEQVSDALITAARQAGVYDYVQVMPNTRFPQFRSISVEIVTKVRTVWEKAAGLEGKTGAPYGQPGSRPPSCLVVIGGSTGGTSAMDTIVQGLSRQLSAVILVAVHLPEKFTSSFVRRLRQLTSLKVVEGRAGQGLEGGKVIIAPGNRNMMVCGQPDSYQDWQIAISPVSEDYLDCPSVDILMQSAAQLAGARVLGVLLTGMGKDGTKGAGAILQAGGKTIAQDEASSVIFGMAKSAIEKGSITRVLALHQIPEYINKFAEYHRV